MYLNVFNNDLLFPCKGFLSLNNLPTVVKVVCCRQVLHLFMSTGLKFCADSYVDICAFPCLHVDRFMQLWSNVFLCRDIQS